MGIEDMTPYIESVDEFLQTCFNASVSKHSIHQSKTKISECDVNAIIELSGRIRGSVTLSLSTETALNMFNRMTGMNEVALSPHVFDAVSEFSNMIGGGAKSRISKDGEVPIDMTLPQIIQGTQLTTGMNKYVTTGISFESELGNFSLDVSYENNQVGDHK